MTALRQKLIDELDLRGFALNTKENYVAPFTGWPVITDDHRPTQRRGTQAVSAPLDSGAKSFAQHANVNVSALRFFYGQVLGRSLTALDEALPRMRKPTVRPRVYSPEEIQRLLSVQRNSRPKHRVLLMTTYAAGLRVSEVCRLKLEDILSSRMQIRVTQGKGGKDRYTILSARLLAELRAYWRLVHPTLWLFPSSHYPGAPLTSDTAQFIFYRAVRLAQLPNHQGIHSLRHSFATHLLEAALICQCCNGCWDTAIWPPPPNTCISGRSGWHC